MSAVEKITAALDEAEKRLGDLRLHDFGMTIAAEAGHCTCGSPLGEYPHEQYCGVEPWIMNLGEDQVQLIVSVVNRERAQIQHARDVLARHVVTRSEDCTCCDSCTACGWVAREDDCHEINSLAAVWVTP